ncbi:MAG: OB-fold nucleic acid binding domain-containing protein [Desulfomonilaceae bacterium]
MHNKVSDAATALRESSSMSVFCRTHPLAMLRPVLTEQGGVTARQLRSIPSGRKLRVSGLLVIVHTPPTKSGKRVMFLTLEDETGLWDAVVFTKAQKEFARVIYTSELLTVEGKLQRQSGNGLSISIIVERVMLPWSGLLSEFLHKPEDDKT